MNIMVIIAGAFAVLGSFGAAFPIYAGTMGVISGTAVVSGTAGPEQGRNDDGGAQMADRVLKAFDSLEKYIDGANGGVFGLPPHS